MRGERHEGLRICRRALEGGGADRTEGRGRTLKLAGLFAISVGERDAAIAYAEESLANIRGDRAVREQIQDGGPHQSRRLPDGVSTRGTRAGIWRPPSSSAAGIGLPSRRLIAMSNLANLDCQGGEYDLGARPLRGGRRAAAGTR